MFQMTPMVKNILLINVAVLVLGFIFPMDLSRIFGVHYFFSEGFYIFQYVTYMWLHGDFFHLLFNMIGVIVFGPMLERVWGAKRFLTFYLITGIGAGLLYGVADIVAKHNLETQTEAFISNPNPDDFYIYTHKYRSNMDVVDLENFNDHYYENTNNIDFQSNAVTYVKRIYLQNTLSVMVGASGALFGILIAFGMLFPNTELILLFPPIPVKAKYLVFFYGAYALYNVINTSTGDNVAHMAHLTGMLVGYIMLKIWQKKRGNFY